MLSPVRPTRSFDEIIRQLRDLIYRGDLQIGDRLPAERTLAEQFEVSRNMVREALRTLEVTGMIELRPGRNGGAFVCSGRPEVVTRSLQDMFRLSAFSLNDLTEARRWLSTAIVRAVAERATDADLDRLEENVAESVKNAKHEDWNSLAQTNMHFLDLLAECTGNPVLQMMHDAVMGILRQISHAVGPIQSDETVRHRRRIVRLLRKRDAEGAAAEMVLNLAAVHAYWLAEMGEMRSVNELIEQRRGTSVAWHKSADRRTES